MNGNALDVFCTGTNELFPDCQLTMTFETHSTRSGDSFRAVTKTTTTYSGTGVGCDYFQDDCKIDVTEGTRTGPAPPAYCATPTRRTSWGQLKILYR